jgi:predicted esterase
MSRPSTRARLLACAPLAFVCAAHASPPAPSAARALVHASTPAPAPARTLSPAPRLPARATPPLDRTTPRPVSFYLHGICGAPAPGCHYFREGLTERDWLLCPRAPASCGGGASSWRSAASTHRVLSEATAELARAAPGQVDTAAPGVLVGFSQGAYQTLALLRQRPGHFRGAVFIGAFVHPTRAELEAAGVRRVVLAAGQRDGTHRAMLRAAQALEREGFPVRFLELGPVGHTFAPAAGTPGWRDALAWVSARD